MKNKISQWVRKALHTLWDKVLKEVLGLLRDPATPDRKLSASRVLLFFLAYKYTSWVDQGIAAQVDPWVFTSLLFGPAIAIAWKTAPVETARSLFQMFGRGGWREISSRLGIGSGPSFRRSNPLSGEGRIRPDEERVFPKRVVEDEG